MDLNSKQRSTLNDVFSKPTRGDIKWASIEALFVALGASITEAKGSRVHIELNDEYIVLHRPHPRPDTVKGAVESVRRFLVQAGIEP